MKISRLIAVLTVVIVCLGGIRFMVGKPVRTSGKVEICPAARNFTVTLPNQLPDATAEVDIETFCNFSYEQGFKAVQLEQAWIYLTFVGTIKDGITLKSTKGIGAPFPCRVTSIILSEDTLVVSYGRDFSVVIIVTAIWIVICGVIVLLILQKQNDN